MEFKEGWGKRQEKPQQVDVETEWNLKVSNPVVSPGETCWCRNRMEFKDETAWREYEHCQVDVETEWNLKFWFHLIGKIMDHVDVETEWNLKVYLFYHAS